VFGLRGLAIPCREPTSSNARISTPNRRLLPAGPWLSPHWGVCRLGQKVAQRAPPSNATTALTAACRRFRGKRLTSPCRTCFEHQKHVNTFRELSLRLRPFPRRVRYQNPNTWAVSATGRLTGQRCSSKTDGGLGRLHGHRSSRGGLGDNGRCAHHSAQGPPGRQCLSWRSCPRTAPATG